MLLPWSPGPAALRKADRRTEASTLKSPLRIARLELAVSSAQSLHGVGYKTQYQSSVHSLTFPARSDWPHLPSPVGDFDPTFCTPLHGKFGQ